MRGFCRKETMMQPACGCRFKVCKLNLAAIYLGRSGVGKAVEYYNVISRLKTLPSNKMTCLGSLLLLYAVGKTPRQGTLPEWQVCLRRSRVWIPNPWLHAPLCWDSTSGRLLVLLTPTSGGVLSVQKTGKELYEVLEPC